MKFYINNMKRSEKTVDISYQMWAVTKREGRKLFLLVLKQGFFSISSNCHEYGFNPELTCCLAVFLFFHLRCMVFDSEGKNKF